jgi:ATP-dependent protease ClpP protease subunit
MKGEIDIVGEITPDTLVNVLAQARAIPADSKELIVNIDSPGGNEAVSDKIASFFDTLGKQITTVQTGIVASAAVKLFLKGSPIRKANSNFPFLIHNTHIDPQDIPVNLDANNTQVLATMLQDSRTSLASFYAKATGNNEQAIIAVMDQDKPMNASQALALGFATEITNEIPILAKMKKTQLNEFIDKIKANVAAALGPASPAPAPVAAPVIVAAYEVGKPAPDLKEGENPQPDGSVVIVEAGVVKEIKPKMEDVQAAKLSALEASVSAIAEQVASLSGMFKAKLDSEKELKASLDAELVNIKNQIKGKHTPATKGINEPGKLSPADEYRKRK